MILSFLSIREQLGEKEDKNKTKEEKEENKVKSYSFQLIAQ